jgi:hypothetical protein
LADGTACSNGGACSVGQTCHAGACSCWVCTPGTSQACDVGDICANCTGTCTLGRQTCATSGQWGSCGGAVCKPPKGGCIGPRCIDQ